MTFKNGKSGNPKGRPVGVPDKRTRLRSLLEPHAEKLIGKAVELALGGDSSALKLCIDRLIPPVKQESFDIHWPEDINKLEAFPLIESEILRSLGRQDMSPEQAKVLLETLKMHRESIGMAELSLKLSKIGITGKD